MEVRAESGDKIMKMPFGGDIKFYINFLSFSKFVGEGMGWMPSSAPDGSVKIPIIFDDTTANTLQRLHISFY